MWNKKEQEPVRPGQAGSAYQPPAAAPAPAPQAPPPAATRKQSAVIGPSMHIKGEIRSDEELLVDGEVEGQVESRSLLTIGQNGKVRANIKAREVVIYGSVNGDIEATEKLAIRDKGQLVGNIKTATISIDDGAYFKGSIDIARPEPKLNAKAG
jgi:cytoskeletal protein CcmA (bactofilin family)